jgi:putative ABC transport system permease protein
MGIGLIEGRAFDTRDGPEGPRTAIVNRTLAEKQWPGESAVGKPIYISWETEEPWEIVGVVEDVRLEGLEEEPREAIYLHFPRTPYFPWMQIAVRSTGDPASLAATLRREIRALDPTLALGRVRVMEDIVTGSTARPRMTAFLMTLFAGLATCLAAVGLYGVLSFVVSQQEKEIGLRLALGASSGEILGSVVREGLGLVGIGLSLGVGVSLFLGRILESLLYGVEPHDPLALGAAGSLLALVALLASFVPAWRASKVPPAEARRAE